MMRWSRALRLSLVLFVAGVLASTGGAQVRRMGSSYVLKALYIKGTTLAFNMTTEVRPFAPGTPSTVQKITLPVVMLVLDVSTRGNLRLAKIRSEAGPIKLNGKPYKDKAVETVTVDHLNRLQQDSSLGTPQFTTPLPTKRLRIGESWSSVIDPSDSVPFAMQVKATYKLLKVDRYYAHVSISIQGKGTGTSSISTQGQGTMLLRNRDGTLHSLKMVQTVSAQGSNGAKSTITVTRRT